MKGRLAALYDIRDKVQVGGCIDWEFEATIKEDLSGDPRYSGWRGTAKAFWVTKGVEVAEVRFYPDNGEAWYWRGQTWIGRDGRFPKTIIRERLDMAGTGILEAVQC